MTKILTEEELRFRESVFQDQYMGSIMPKKPYQYSQEIIASHRSLLSANENLNGHIEGLMQSLEDREPYYAQEYQKMLAANAELSFKNGKLEQEVAILKQTIADWTKQYDELEEQAAVWREESGN